MSFQRLDTCILFHCDGVECMRKAQITSTDFVKSWLALQDTGWIGLKQVGQPWQMFCAQCRVNAEAAHRLYRQHRAGRERHRARNGAVQCLLP